MVADAANDMEPAWDCNNGSKCAAGGSSNGANTYSYPVRFNQNAGKDNYNALWDYGSNESGLWTNDMAYYAADGTRELDCGEVYSSGTAQNWENLAYWADAAGGNYRGFWVFGVMSEYPACCLTAHQSYDTMLGDLDYNSSAPAYQPSVDYLTDI